MDDDENEDDDLDAPQDGDPSEVPAVPPPRLVLEGGHDRCVCLFVRTTSKDRSQILTCSHAMLVGSSLTPTAVITECAQKLNADLKELPVGFKIKDLDVDILGRLRLKARSVRKAIIDES